MQIQGNVPKPAGPEARPSACPARPDRLPSGKRVQRYALMRNGQTKQGTFFEENQGRQEKPLSHRTIHGENHSGKRRKGRKRTHLLYYIYARKTEGNGSGRERIQARKDGIRDERDGKRTNRQETTKQLALIFAMQMIHSEDKSQPFCSNFYKKIYFSSSSFEVDGIVTKTLSMRAPSISTTSKANPFHSIVSPL